MKIPLIHITEKTLNGKTEQIIKYLIELQRVLSAEQSLSDIGVKSEVKAKADSEEISLAQIKRQLSGLYVTDSTFNTFKAETNEGIEKDAENELLRALWQVEAVKGIKPYGVISQALSEGETVTVDERALSGTVFNAVTGENEALLLVKNGNTVSGSGHFPENVGPLTVGKKLTAIYLDPSAQIDALFKSFTYDENGICVVASFSAEGKTYNLGFLNLSIIVGTTTQGYAVAISEQNGETGKVIYSTLTFDFSSVYPWLKSGAGYNDNGVIDMVSLTGESDITAVSVDGSNAFNLLNGTAFKSVYEAKEVFILMTLRENGGTVNLTADTLERVRHKYMANEKANEAYEVVRLLMIL